MQGEMKEVINTLAGLAQIRSNPIFAVGGTVRDLILQRKLKDLDFLVLGDVWKVASDLSLSLGGKCFVLDEAHHQVRVVVPTSVPSIIDLAGTRHETLGQNLRMRDFTINAMALDIEALRVYVKKSDSQSMLNAVIDPLNGQTDLQNRTIRQVTTDGFRQDPLRLLRAVRLAGQLDFTIESSTQENIRRQAEMLTEVAAERISNEIFLMLGLSDSHVLFLKMTELGLLQSILPELTETSGITQNEHHSLDVLGHSLAALQELESQPWKNLDLDEDYLGTINQCLMSEIAAGKSYLQILKLAALTHDVGKPQCREVRNKNRVTFYGHEKAGAMMARGISERLKLSRKESNLFISLVEQHMRPLLLFLSENHTLKAEFRLFRQLGDNTIPLLLLALADRSAGKPAEKDQQIREFFAFIRLLINRYYQRYFPLQHNTLLNGKDISEITGIEPGPQIGLLMNKLCEAQFMGQVNDLASAINFIKNHTLPDKISSDRKRGPNSDA